MHAYLIALEIEPVMVNKVYVALPLHCTVVHWFRSEKSPAEILRAITPVASNQAPIELISAGPDLFGLNKDVPVNRIKNDESVREFHGRLHDALQTMSIIDAESQWTKQGFTPHVTRQSSGRFEEGRQYTARKLYLVEALVPDELQQKKVVSKIFIGKALS